MCVSIPEADPDRVSFLDPARGLQDLQGHAEVSHIYLQLLTGSKKCPESIISSSIALLQLWNISQGMDEREDGKQQENSPDQTLPKSKQHCRVVQLQLHLKEFDLSMSKTEKVTKKEKNLGSEYVSVVFLQLKCYCKSSDS